MLRFLLGFLAGSVGALVAVLALGAWLASRRPRAATPATTAKVQARDQAVAVLSGERNHRRTIHSKGV